MSFRAFSNTKIPSQVIDKTYIFEEDNNNLAVFSIHTNPENLWSEESGIYVPIFPNSQISSYPYFESNFWQPWSKFSRLEYFNSNKEKKAEEHLDLKFMVVGLEQNLKSHLD